MCSGGRRTESKPQLHEQTGNIASAGWCRLLVVSAGCIMLLRLRHRHLATSSTLGCSTLLQLQQTACSMSIQQHFNQACMVLSTSPCSHVIDCNVEGRGIYYQLSPGGHPLSALVQFSWRCRWYALPIARLVESRNLNVKAGTVACSTPSADSWQLPHR